jgi:hypothetical protein
MKNVKDKAYGGYNYLVGKFFGGTYPEEEKKEEVKKDEVKNTEDDGEKKKGD